MTNWGLSSKSTVNPPSTACAATPPTRPSDSQTGRAAAGERRSDPSTARITATETSPVKTRLTNSIMAFASLVSRGERLPGEQLGQSGHPRPESVSRTAPPVTMMTASSTAATNVTRRYAAGLKRGSRARG